jgi:hypothetical protein
MDKTLEDECRKLPLPEFSGSPMLQASFEMMAKEYARRAVEMAIRRAAEVCATQKVFTGPKACAAAILKLLD